MNATGKILRSWWVLISFILLINGLGFVYIGLKHNNRNWVLEGVAYHVPWLFCFLYSNYDPVFNPCLAIAVVLMLVSIVRSFWVASKLADVYDNEEKYSVRPTVIRNHVNPQDNGGSSAHLACCVCIVVIFILFVFAGIF